MHNRLATFELSNGAMSDPLSLFHLAEPESAIFSHFPLEKLGLGKTLNAWIAVTRRVEFMRFDRSLLMDYPMDPCPIL